MLPLSLLALAYTSFIVNFELLSLPISSVAVRILFLATALAFVVKRGVDFFVIACLAATMMLIALLGFATDYSGFSWTPVLFGFAQVVIIYLFLACRFSDEDARGILLIAALVPLLVLLIGLAYNLAGLHPMFATGTQAIPRLQGSLIPAFLSAFALSGAYAALKLALPSHGWGYYALALINLTILIATGGRMPIVLAVPLCLALIVASPHLSTRAKIGIPFTGLIVVSLPAVLVGQTMIERFERGGSSGRDVMWDYFQGIADSHWWTGIGYMQGYYMDLPHALAIAVNTTAVHNDFVRLSAELGFPGMVAFYALLSIAYLHGAVRNGGWAGFPVALATYLVFLIYSWSDNSFGTVCNNMLIVLGVVAESATVRTPVEPRVWPGYRFPNAGPKRPTPAG